MLRPIRDRRNIHIAIDAQVTKVMMKKYSDGKPRAYGVRFQRHGKMHKVVARKEVSRRFLYPGLIFTSHAADRL